jgi:cyclase
MFTSAFRGALMIVGFGTSVLAAPGVADAQMNSDIRVVRLTDYLIAFYDGRPRVPPQSGEKRNWIEYGSMDLGIATYAIHRGNQALIYDSFPTTQQAKFARDHLEQMGIKRFVVVNSHWHLDHTGGNAVYRDEVIISSKGTFQTLQEKKEAIEAGKEWGPPAIKPFVSPNVMFEGRMDVMVGDLKVELHNVNIHTPDSVVAFIPADKILLAGDTIEDSVVFVSTPTNVVEQIDNLMALKKWDIARIYPNHGNIEVIKKGGYDKGLIDATAVYLKNMVKRAHNPDYLNTPIEAVISESVAKGWVSLWEPYRHVHEINLKRLQAQYKDKPLPVLKD